MPCVSRNLQNTSCITMWQQVTEWQSLPFRTGLNLFCLSAWSHQSGWIIFGLQVSLILTFKLWNDQQMCLILHAFFFQSHHTVMMCMTLIYLSSLKQQPICSVAVSQTLHSTFRPLFLWIVEVPAVVSFTFFKCISVERTKLCVFHRVYHYVCF